MSQPDPPANEAHFCISVETWEEDGDWYSALCSCGEDFAPYPSAGDAVDAIVEHISEMTHEAFG